MAEYNKIDGFVFDEQTIQGWGKTLKMSGKAPAVAKRIFDTLEHAQEYIDDPNDSAIEGLLLTVVADGDNNGVYLVERVGTVAIEGSNTEKGVLVKVNSDDIERIESIIDEKIQVASSQLREADATLQENINEISNELESAKGQISQDIGEFSEKIESYTINGKLISESPNLNSDDIQISENYTTLQEVNDNVSPGDFLTTALSKIEVMLANTTLALTAALNDLESKIGKPIEYNEGGEIVAHATGVYAKLDEVVSEVDNKISALESKIGNPSEHDENGDILVESTGIYTIINELDEKVNTTKDDLNQAITDSLAGLRTEFDATASNLDTKIDNTIETLNNHTHVMSNITDLSVLQNNIDEQLNDINNRIDVIDNVDGKIIANALVDLDDRVNTLESKNKGA